jgi:hypothetical protein
MTVWYAGWNWFYLQDVRRGFERSLSLLFVETAAAAKVIPSAFRAFRFSGKTYQK